jgi:hypothetical protein
MNADRLGSSPMPQVAELADIHPKILLALVMLGGAWHWGRC